MEAGSPRRQSKRPKGTTDEDEWEPDQSPAVDSVSAKPKDPPAVSPPPVVAATMQDSVSSAAAVSAQESGQSAAPSTSPALASDKDEGAAGAAGTAATTTQDPKPAVASQAAPRGSLGLSIPSRQEAGGKPQEALGDNAEEPEESWRPAADVFDSDDDIRLGDGSETVGALAGGEFTPTPTTAPQRVAATVNGHISPARVNGRLRQEIINAGSSTQPLPSRQRRVSSQHRVSMCQRLLQLYQLKESSPTLGIQLSPDVLQTSSLLGSGTPSHARAQPPGSPPSPARRATLSGTMRVYGEGEPDITDSDRLLYMRRLKGLVEGTKLSVRGALRVLYFCTGDWVSARKYIVSGPSEIPPGCMWTAKEDEILLQGMSTDKMEHLRELKGSVEVYRRLQFLNTFHGLKTK
ncbi:hypothetical protein GQ54DRAFT_310327 [Martensiomyces pterosporus]|nr:hypothetical protein GQ54DRAFT_310327 [Martensiomyces pterosporus]